ncbi:MAG: isoaspartyl peptidase/L-asparaginase family protein [Candidatus Bathyarchaeia archaeon]|nr:isoaspartyl peptidase/L-asparaginase family protein [Candidatus Bathyarchaeota archaeon]
MQKRAPVILVHGGAGEWPLERRDAGLAGVREAAEKGFRVLEKNGAALDAVETAVKVMEDMDVFNAGLGSSLTIEKKIEMEASIMDGKTLRAGATSLLSDIKNPVHLARLIMENTDHVYIVGEGAEKLAQLFKLERRNAATQSRLESWNKLKEQFKKGKLEYLPKIYKLVKEHPSLFQLDTVGAVALDKDGNVAAATSTGGVTLKFPGRIGDTPLIGCGTYADNEAGACSATGMGEIAVRLVLSKSVCDQMREGSSAQKAVEKAIRTVNRRIRDTFNHMGLIAVDKKGDVEVAHNSPNICHAYMRPGMDVPFAAMQAKIIK